ncbi:MAG: hypothetical protein WCJ95_13255 [Mariniphaga sp.]
MKIIGLTLFLHVVCIGLSAQVKSVIADTPVPFKNYWSKAPDRTPSNFSVDAPLMGNGDLTMSVGFQDNLLRFYLSKDDFWRLRSQADGLSGPRVVGFVDLEIDGFDKAGFSAIQLIKNGVTTCQLKNGGQKIEFRSWVSATANLIFIEVNSPDREARITLNLTAPQNRQAILKTGKAEDIFWLTRSFADSVDIPTEVAVALKVFNYKGESITVQPGKKLVIALAVESKFKKEDPLGYVQNRVKMLNTNSEAALLIKHNQWWQKYWNRSCVSLEDTVLMKSWYQGLYTIAACSRDPKFPPGLFGWTTNDTPAWNGDYHLNYNFQAPFYSICSANHLEQVEPHDQPLLDFIPRGEFYGKNVTKTRGILYPVGIGPLGIEVTRNFAVGGYQKNDDIEFEGLFYGQRSNAAYGLINMAEHWRCTYDLEYGKKILPYALAVATFWEDYLKFENGRYVIYGDAIHEGSGKDKNPVLSLGLIRNAFDLMIDLSSALKRDEDRQPKWRDILAKLSDFPIQHRNGKEVFRYTEEGLDWVDGNGLGIQQIYPCNAITLDSKPELLSVARNTIEMMQRWHDQNTSNSFFAAAIRVGYDSSAVLKELHNYALHTFPNGFQSGNPHGIENSCTVTNAINEMFCMSVGNVIRIFGHFPGNQKAIFKNIRTWGAFLVSAQISGGLVSNVSILSEKGKLCTCINPWPGKKVVLIRNGKPEETISGDRISFETSANEKIELKSE